MNILMQFYFQVGFHSDEKDSFLNNMGCLGFFYAILMAKTNLCLIVNLLGTIFMKNYVKEVSFMTLMLLAPSYFLNTILFSRIIIIIFSFFL